MNAYGSPAKKESEEELQEEQKLINEMSMQKLEVLNKDGRIGSPETSLFKDQSSKYIIMEGRQDSKIRIQN